MEYEISGSGEAWDVECRTWGVADVDMWLRLRHDLLVNRFRRGMDLLTDHSALDISGLTKDDGRLLAEQVSALAEWFGPGRVAIVAPAGASEAAAQIVSQIESDLEQRIFATREEAIAWLRAERAH